MQIRWTAALRRRKLKLKPASFQVEHHRSGVRGTQDPTLCLSSAQNRIGDEVLLQLSSCDESWSSLGQTFTQNLLRGGADERIRHWAWPGKPTEEIFMKAKLRVFAWFCHDFSNRRAMFIEFWSKNEACLTTRSTAWSFLGTASALGRRLSSRSATMPMPSRIGSSGASAAAIVIGR